MPKYISGELVNEEKWAEAKKRAKEEGHTEDYAYITSIYKKMVGLKSFTFFSESCTWNVVETKSGKKYFVEGYISTFDKDIYNELVTVEGMTDMLQQLKDQTIKLDLEHETWRNDEGEVHDHPKNFNPVGKIIDAKIDDNGLFVKAEINKHSSRFKEVWNSIQEGFLDAFSIAYKPVRVIENVIEDSAVRLLDSIDLLNVALTGNPINPCAKMTDVFTKSLSVQAKDIQEDITMEKKKVVAEPVVEPVAEVKSEPEAAEEAKVEETPAKKAEVEVKDDPNIDFGAELKSRDSRIEVLEKAVAELKSKLEEPVLKSKIETAPQLEEERSFKPLDLIK